MKYPNNIPKIVSLIKKSQTFALVSHINPDGDTLGSTLALYYTLLKMNKEVCLFCDSVIDGKVTVLEGVKEYNKQAFNTYDMAIAIDCSDLGRLGVMYGEFSKGKIKSCIDHHETNNNYANVNVVEPDASATAEIMYKVINLLGANLIDEKIAKLLYTAIVTDSGCFSFSSVSSQTHAIAAELIKFDIHAEKICSHFIKEIKKDVFDLKTEVLSKSKFYLDGKVALIVFTQEMFLKTNTSKSNTDGIINDLINIDNVEIAVAMTEMNESLFKCSVRTKENVNAANIALRFGGGGHNRAAGFAVNSLFEDAKDRIIRECSFALD